MGYLEIVKKGFHVGNHNLAVLLTEFISGVVLFVVFFIFLVAVILMAVGSLPSLSADSLTSEGLSGLLQSSLAVIPIVVCFALVFILLAAILTSYVHSGNLGCIIETAKGEARGFTASNFFGIANRSVFSMLGLYIIWGVIFLCAFMLLAIIAGIGIGAVLMPLKDAGRQVLAFAVGVPFLVVLILAGMLAMFFFYAGWVFSAFILVGRRLTASSSLGASYRFIRENFWDSLLFTLFMLALIIAAKLVTNVVTMPFSLLAETRPVAAIGFLPLVLLGLLLQMYVGLIARSSFAVYYIARTAPPPAPPAPPVEETPEAVPVEPPEPPAPGQE